MHGRRRPLGVSVRGAVASIVGPRVSGGPVRGRRCDGAAAPRHPAVRRTGPSWAGRPRSTSRCRCSPCVVIHRSSGCPGEVPHVLRSVGSRRPRDSPAERSRGNVRAGEARSFGAVPPVLDLPSPGPQGGRGERSRPPLRPQRRPQDHLRTHRSDTGVWTQAVDTRPHFTRSDAPAPYPGHRAEAPRGKRPRGLARAALTRPRRGCTASLPLPDDAPTRVPPVAGARIGGCPRTT